MRDARAFNVVPRLFYECICAWPFSTMDNMFHSAVFLKDMKSGKTTPANLWASASRENYDRKTFIFSSQWR